MTSTPKTLRWQSVSMCLVCAEAILQPSQGRPRSYCSNRCRQAAYRRRNT